MAAIQYDDFGPYMQCGRVKQRIRYERINDEPTADNLPNDSAGNAAQRRDDSSVSAGGTNAGSGE